jgi:hypothetical protein
VYKGWLCFKVRQNRTSANRVNNKENNS